MSRIAILGASGRLGRHLVSNAIDRGLEVSALVRHPAKITIVNFNLTLIKGDVATGEGLEATLEGCRDVLCALGSRRPVMTACTRNLVRELRNVTSLRSFVFFSWLGAGDSAMQAKDVTEFRSVLARTTRKKMFKDISRAEEVVRTSGLPYLILRPTRLTDGGPTDSLVAVGHQQPAPGPVSRADLARFVFWTLDQPGWHAREVTVGSRRT